MNDNIYSEIVNQMAKDVLLSPFEVYSIAKTACYRYKEFKIPKKNGGFRFIAQPTPVVKELQRWVSKNILSSFPVHDNAYAYIKGKNIYKNAEKHKDSAFICKLDFKDYFTSIKAEDFILLLRKNAREFFKHEDLELLIRILFKKKRETSTYYLAIGSPSSPTLSNVIMYDFDTMITTYCDENKLKYSRYADDITISGDTIDNILSARDIIQHYLDIMESPKLSLNAKKTVLISKKYKRVVTGLVITNDGKISIGRDKKRKIRAAIHHYVIGLLELSDKQWLKGYLSYIKDVEPKYLLSLNKKYGAKVIMDILKDIH